MVYVVSDLHGFPLNKFLGFLEEIGFNDDDTLYVLGDVIDRGYDGVNILLWLYNQKNVKFILGNHEQMMLDSKLVYDESSDVPVKSLDPFSLPLWTMNGGAKTFEGLNKLNEDDYYHVMAYVRRAPLYEEITVNGRDFVLVHAGLPNFDKNKKLDKYDDHDLLWHRPDLFESYYTDKTVIFGHTPTAFYGDKYYNKIVITDTWIDIDIGTNGVRYPAILRLDDMKVFYKE